MARPSDERADSPGSLDRTIREMSAALGPVSNREELFETVQVSLSERFEFVWIGSLDIEDWTVRTVAGPASIIDPMQTGDSGTRAGLPPMMESAVRERRVLVTSTAEVGSDSSLDVPAETVACIPILHQNSRYGLLLLGDDPARIEEAKEVFADIGSIVGQALARIDYRTAMMGGGSFVEFFEPDALTKILEEHAPPDATVRFENTVPLPDGSVLQYVSVQGMDEESFREQVEAFGDVRDIRVVSKDDTGAVYETVYTGPSVVKTIAEHNGEVLHSWYENRDHYTIARIPEDTSVTQVIDAVTSTVPDIEIVAQRSVLRDLPAGETKVGIRNTLTDKQRVVAETALAAGYFERPRESQAGDLAETLGISTATVSQHLRAAHRKVYGALFDHDR